MIQKGSQESRSHAYAHFASKRGNSPVSSKNLPITSREITIYQMIHSAYHMKAVSYLDPGYREGPKAIY
ncbi:MAG: hypothetical protein AAF388_22015 [Bacteroidota bacterium]